MTGRRRLSWRKRYMRSFLRPEVFFEQLLQMMVTNYSECGFGIGRNLLRTCRTLGWREIKTLASQTKFFLRNRKVA